MKDKKPAGIRIAKSLAAIIPPERLKTDALYTYAYSGDASYFRLVPALVAIVNSPSEVQLVLNACLCENIGITFRAAGTSLSGQAVGDGVLLVLGDGWNDIEILDGGNKITLGPGTIVANANASLKPYNKKIGPDPASIATCKIGGVVANNASGMCCGTAQNTYQTMSDICLILADGTELDSSSTSSRKEFKNKRPDIIDGLKELSAKIHSDKQLLDLITRKYEIKNTVGYSLNALIDFNDPIDMLTHLLVGSEGTLGFVTSVTYNSVDDHPHKATALVPFASNHIAAKGVQALHTVGVSAAEFMERKALEKVEHLPAMAAFNHILSKNSPAVLIEIMADSDQKLDQEINAAIKAMEKIGTLSTPDFTKDPNIQAGLWDIRKGMFASVGAIRPKGSLMLTEDLAVPIDRLADVVDDLRLLLDKHQYHEGVIFGHALSGNLHFQMHGDFTKESELRRFADLGADLCDLISIKYKGSLKAEHGTGRAIAPFVEAEWGKKAYEIMQQIKQLLDPQNILNPGVLLNDNKNAHIENTKHMVTSDDLVDLCVECGVCEPICPSAGFTLTPRQRIAVNREQARLKNSGENKQLLSELSIGFSSAVMDTCAGCSLCATLCPIGIDTGAMVLNKRSQQNSPLSKKIAALAATNTPVMESISKVALSSLSLLPGDLGKNMPVPPPKPKLEEIKHKDKSKDVIYFPACPSRIFGASKTSLGLLPLTKAMPILLKRAGFNPILSNNIQGLCCGQPFASKGFPHEARQVGEKLGAALNKVKNNRQIKIITDASTCAKHMNQNNLQAIDSVEFLLKEVVPRLNRIKPIKNLAVHLNCASKTTKGSSLTKALAQICAKDIAVLNSVTCCGYAGDKGIFHPKLNAYALRFGANDLPENCKIGVSTVSTCAIGLTKHLQIPFVSLASILEYVSRPQS
ncbi:MAG: FAD-binding oxidoreductase [Devosiaceae bacterium]|nr:FAD-binding oxidoreductase [Devosiaceae bacterium]